MSERNRYEELDAVLAAYAEIGEGAPELLTDELPNALQHFKQAANKLRKLLEEVQVVFPRANLYVDDGCLCLLLDSSHETGCGKACKHRVAGNEFIGNIGGGGW